MNSTNHQNHKTTKILLTFYPISVWPKSPSGRKGMMPRSAIDLPHPENSVLTAALDLLFTSLIFFAIF